MAEYLVARVSEGINYSMSGSDIHCRSFLVPAYGQEEERYELEAIIEHCVDYKIVISTAS